MSREFDAANLRDEMNAKFKEMEEKHRDAPNAGGDRASSSHTEPPPPEPETFKIGKPATKDESTNEPYAVQCSYCSGSVPKVIAEHCQFCDLYFHPGHYQKHLDEWPCPLVDYDLCPWCADHIEEHDDVLTCEVCQLTLHTRCYAEHCPCPDKMAAKKKGQTTQSAASAPATDAPTVDDAVQPTITTAQSRATELYNKFLADM